MSIAPSPRRRHHAGSTPSIGIRKREANKLEKRLCRQVGQAIADFNMIEDGDKVMVCLSGGKDSYGCSTSCCKLQARAPVRFELVAVNLDQKQPGFPAHVLPEYLTQLGVPFHIENQDTYSIVKRQDPRGKTMCSLCSACAAASCTAWPTSWAHQDRAGPPPRRHAADALPQHVLRRQAQGHAAQAGQRRRPPRGDPPAGLRGRERPDRWAEHAFPIIPCNLCGSQENLQRKQVALP
jgi:tRNA 2-thiocytidine biosynthesis protein TtcA